MTLRPAPHFTLLLLTLLLAACTRESDTGRPQDDPLAADGPRPDLETPNIHRLATEGALFTNSFTAVPLHSPDRVILLTGQYPSRHGIIDDVLSGGN